MVLCLAGNRAGVTTNALAVVNDESVSHQKVLPGRQMEQPRGLGIVADRFDCDQ
jgi:hypothetical protein